MVGQLRLFCECGMIWSDNFCLRRSEPCGMEPEEEPNA